MPLDPDRKSIKVSAHATHALAPLTANIFGARLEGVEYVPRPSVYALMQSPDHRIAVVATPRGHALPGGGAHAGESPIQTLEREVREECSAHATIIREVATAIEYIMTDDAGPVAKHCTFFEATLGEPAGTPVESDHQLRWLTPEEAAAAMTHLSHAWAIRQFTGAL